MEIRVLGPLEVVEADSTTVSLGGARQQRLLAALTVRAGQVVDEDRIVDALWDDGEPLPENPRASVQTYVSRLRSILGTDAVTSHQGGYLLNVTTTLDASLFEAAVTEARSLRERGDLDGAIDALGAGLALWRGDAYGDLADLEVTRTEADRLNELRIVACELFLELRLNAGRAGEVVADAEAMAADHPLRDGPVRILALARYRLGQQPEATRALQRYRQSLAEETGLEPSPELVALEQQILDHDPRLEVEAPIRRLGSYELGEQVGEGAFGAIYRATQPSVGREVAIKVIRPELANDPEFIRRFEIEAHTVARLEHPHIVPLHDYWRDPSGAYLVMRYLRGGSAASRLVRDGAWPLADVARLVDEIGAALAIAHDAGVVHRDVKPENILFDDVGNAYLADFGIATDSGVSQADLRSAGSPLYVSPEQVRDGESSATSDIYAFGVVLYELLTGRTPFGDSDSVAALLERKLAERVPSITADRPEAPSGVDLVIQTATATDPSQRFPTMGDLVLAFRAASVDSIDAGTTTSTAARPREQAVQTLISLELEATNPYKGLAAFDETDAGDFHGRTALIDELVERTSHSRFTVVTGPSGSGKSSVVRAGLLPRLRDSGAFVASIIPGTHPMDELETALLRIASGPTGALLEQLTGDERGLGRAVKTILPDANSELVLVIDQFEELFTLTPEHQRDHFLAAVAHAVTDERSQLRVVATLRADFYDRPLQHPSISDAVKANTVAVSPLSGEELDAAITAPAARVGVAIEPALVAELVSEVRGHPAALPMLQYALTELYEARANGRMTIEAYRDLGGITGALANRANEIHDQFPTGLQAHVQRLFTRLITPGEGTEDTRRRVPLRELSSIDPEVIDGYGSARLLAFDHDPTTREPTVEVAHEAIIREWPQLRAWLDDDRDGLRVHRHLGISAHAWQSSNRDAGELYRSGRLEAATEWVTGHPDDLNLLESDFLATSVELRETEESAERERFDLQVRSNRRLRSLLAGVAVLLALALLAGAFAFQQQNKASDARDEAEANAQIAEEQARDADEARLEAQAQTGIAEEQAALATEQAALAETRRMVADAAAIVEENPDVALLLASEAYRRSPEPQTLAGLQRVLTGTGQYLGTIAPGEEFLAGGWLADGTIVGMGPQAMTFYDGSEHVPVRSVNLPSPATDPLVGAPPLAIEGRTAAAGTQDGSVVLADVDDTVVIKVAEAPISAVALSADGRFLAAGDASGAVHLIERGSGSTIWTTQVILHSTFAELMTTDHPVYTFLATFNSGVFGSGPSALEFDGPDSLLAGAGVHVRRLSLATGAITREILFESSPLPTLPPWPRAVVDLAIGADGTITAIAGSSAPQVSEDLTEISWGVPATGRAQNVAPKSVAVDGTGEAWFGLDNGQLAKGIVSAFTEPSDPRPTGLPVVRSLEISDDSGEVLVAGPGGLILRSVDDRQLLARSVPRGMNNEFSISADGTLVIASNIDLGVDSLFYDLTEATPTELSTDAAPLTNEFYVPDDPLQRYVIAHDNRVGGKTVLHRDTLTSTGLTFPNTTFGPAFSSDGRFAAFTSGVGSFLVTVFEFPSGRQVSPPLDMEPWTEESDLIVRGIAFDNDGSRLFASLGSGTTVVFDTTTWIALTEIAATDGAGAMSARFSPDGELLVTRGTDGSIALRDPTTLDINGTIEGGVSAAELIGPGPYFSHDGNYLLVLRDQTPRLWHLPTTTDIGTFPHDPGLVANGDGLGDHLRLVTGLGDNAMIWNLDVDSWPEIACRAAGRNMTLAEWEQFGPDGEPYQVTCPQWPSLG